MIHMSKITALLPQWLSLSLWWLSCCVACGEPFGYGQTHYRGCARGHGPVQSCEYCERYNQLYQRRASYSVDDTDHGGNVRGVAVASSRLTLPYGVRINDAQVRSPYSDYVVDATHLTRHHVVTDHAVQPKSNFFIP